MWRTLQCVTYITKFAEILKNLQYGHIKLYISFSFWNPLIAEVILMYIYIAQLCISRANLEKFTSWLGLHGKVPRKSRRLDFSKKHKIEPALEIQFYIRISPSQLKILILKIMTYPNVTYITVTYITIPNKLRHSHIQCKVKLSCF